MIFDGVLMGIVPDENEKRRAVAKYEEISKLITDRYGNETLLVGSVAKDTFLKGDKDLDIFVFFDPIVGREQLVEESLRIGKEVFAHYGSDYLVEYSEHPYISGTIDEFKVEIVPCYKIGSIEKMVSSVDRTPFHLEFINSNLRPDQRDHVRLLKKFLKSQKMYGADAKVNGFSGYLCELLIVRYGTFHELLNEATKWSMGERIEVTNGGRNFKDPLVVIDPVDPNRNVASPVSADTLSRFVLSSRGLVESNDVGMFDGPEQGYERIDGGLLAAIVIDVEVLEDIYYAQCRRFLKAVERACRTEGFGVYRSGIFSKGVFLDIEAVKLPPLQKHRGPAIGNQENVTKFLEKNDFVFAEDGHLYAIRARKFIDVIDVIDDTISNKIGMGKHVKNANIRVLLDNEANSILNNEIVYY